MRRITSSRTLRWTTVSYEQRQPRKRCYHERALIVCLVLYGLQEVDEADERAVELFMPTDATPRRSLADLIMSKLREHEEQIQQTQQAEELKNVEPNVSYSAHHPKVASVYNGYVATSSSVIDIVARLLDANAAMWVADST